MVIEGPSSQPTLSQKKRDPVSQASTQSSVGDDYFAVHPNAERLPTSAQIKFLEMTGVDGDDVSAAIYSPRPEMASNTIVKFLPFFHGNRLSA